MVRLKKVGASPIDWPALFMQQWPRTLALSGTVELAFSGGVDSTVLLDGLVRIREQFGFRLSAVHVHHGLNNCADQWAEHCEVVCTDYQVPLQIAHVNITHHKNGIEAAARQARYAIFCRSQAHAVLLAHHADDQAETYLLQALRGGSVHALCAMQMCRALTPDILLWRPLLMLTKAELIAYAKAAKLRWVEDGSNANTHYRRNWLRHAVMPVLGKGVPNYQRHLQHSATCMADAAALLDEIILQDLSDCMHQGCLLIERLQRLSNPRQKQLLLRWAQKSALGTPSKRSLDEFLRQIQQAKLDKLPTWHLPNGQVYCYRSMLWPLPDAKLSCGPVRIDHTDTVALPQWGGVLSWCVAKDGLPYPLIQAGLYLMRAPAGTRFYTKSGAKRLNKLFQTVHLPIFLQKRWPVLLNTNQCCVAIPSIRVASDQAVNNGFWPQWVMDDLPDFRPTSYSIEKAT
ncbi:MAG: tRNA lysidine(34) synthetase TilS [Neisseriales bacterium]|nr:MAG: tRNA lysidine(34) synthetase TilS [Neisseriales bacterium]